MPGQGISAHIDTRSYGDVICCYTMGSGAKMRYKNKDIIQDIYLEPNSLYIMSGPARKEWTHEKSGLKSDIVGGKRIKRDRRISITFRNVPDF